MNQRLTQIDGELASAEQRATSAKENLGKDRAHWRKLIQKRPVQKALSSNCRLETARAR